MLRLRLRAALVVHRRGDPQVELYLAGHIPGASFLDVDDDLSDLSISGQGRHPLPGAERFAAAAGRAGIGEGVYVVGYGSMGGAERLWWLLRHFGHDECAVLAGGVDAWLGPLATGEEEVEPAAFTPRERGGDTIEAEEIVERLDDPRLVLVDARLPALQVPILEEGGDGSAALLAEGGPHRDGWGDAEPEDQKRRKQEPSAHSEHPRDVADEEARHHEGGQ